jgi:tetratricopeptide (TPR) repeat protein
MISHAQPAAHLSPETDRIDAAGRWLVAGLLVFMPVAFGGVHAWAQALILTATAILAALLIARGVRSGGRAFRWSWAHLPAIGFLAIGLVQLLPLPEAMIDVLSPNTLQFKRSLTADLGAQGWGTLSFYPHATWSSVRFVLTILVMFVAVFHLFRTSDHIRWLLRFVGLVGGALALFALVQSILGNGRMYWTIETPSLMRSGPFVNRNHFGQFMLLSMGAAIGAIFVDWPSATRSSDPGRHHLRGSDFGGKRLLIGLLAGSVILCGLAMAHAGSRGSVVAMAIAGVVMVAVATASRRHRHWATILSMGGAAVVLVSGLFAIDLLYDRFAAVGDVDTATRLTIAGDLMRVFGDYPLTGVGMGAHETFYPSYQTLATAKTAVQADTDYPQLLEEMGLMGATVLVVLVGVIVFAWIGAVRHSRQPIAAALFGLGFGGVAVMVQSGVDFGQRIPAVAALTAVTAGLILSIARLPRLSDSAQPETVDPPAEDVDHATRLAPRIGGVAAVLAVACLFGVTLPQAYVALSAEHHWQRVRRFERRLRNVPIAPPAVYVEVLAAATAAVKADPGDAHRRFRLNVYRWHTLGLALRAESTRALSPQRLAQVETILADLQRVRRACPTHGSAMALEGAIRLTIGQPEQGGELIARAHRLRANDPDICMMVASAELHAGRTDRLYELVRRAVDLRASLYEPAVDLLLTDRANRPDLAYRLAGDDQGRLIGLANRLQDVAPTWATVARERAMEILESRCRRGACSEKELAQLASILARRGDHDRAAQTYRRAIDRNHGAVAWRMARARSLVELGRFDEAEKELKICLRLQRTHVAARRMLEKVALMPRGPAPNDESKAP